MITSNLLRVLNKICLKQKIDAFSKFIKHSSSPATLAIFSLTYPVYSQFIFRNKKHKAGYAIFHYDQFKYFLILGVELINKRSFKTFR